MWQQSWASQSPGTKNTTVGQRSLSRCTIAMIWCDKAKSCWFILIFFMPRFANRIFLGQYMSNSCPTKLNTLFSGILPAKEFWVCRDCRHGIHTQKKNATTSGPTSTMNMAHTLIMKKQNTDDHTKAFKPQVFWVLGFWMILVHAIHGPLKGKSWPTRYKLIWFKIGAPNSIPGVWNMCALDVGC